MPANKNILEIVIVSWNSSGEIGECLRAFEPLPEGWQVSVVDNASSDSTVEFIKENFPYVNVVANTDNVGFAKANNQIINATDSDYVLVLNPDTVASRGSIGSAIEKLSSKPRAGVLGVKILNTDGTLQPSAKRFPTPFANFIIATGLHSILPRTWQRDLLLAQYWEHDEERAVDWVMGSFMLVKREAIDRVGAIPDEYFMYFEEVDWCYQVHRGGFEVWFTPDIAITHHGSKSSDQKPSEWRASLMYEGKYKFCKRNYGGFKTKLIQATDFAGYTVRKWYFRWFGRAENTNRYDAMRLSQAITRRWLLSK
jgi:N-acetylglucosaminyl-diphospho-decaprenol L-rhamnosyltransferase